MKKIVNVYNGFIGTHDQGGGIKYVENLIKLQKKYFDVILLLGLGKGQKKKIKIDGTEVIYHPISNSHNWMIFILKVSLFLLRNRNYFSNLTFHIHRVYFAPFLRVIKTKKIIATVHTKTFDVFEQKFPILKFITKIFIVIEKYIIKFSIDSISFAGKVSLNLYKKRHKNLNKKFIYLPPVFKFIRSKKSNFFKKEKKKIILVVGRLSDVKRPIKALELFLNSIKKDNYVKNNYKIFFAGHGELKKKMKFFIRQNNLSKHVLGIQSIKSSKIPDLYKRSAVVLFLSKNEVNPYVIKEALFSGTPIFSTNVGTAKNMISNINGMLISPTNIDNSVEKFIFFLKKKFNSKQIIKSCQKFIRNDQKILEKAISKIYN